MSLLDVINIIILLMLSVERVVWESYFAALAPFAHQSAIRYNQLNVLSIQSDDLA